MLESHQKDRGSRHDTGESLKRKGIWTQCQRAAEKMKGSGHDAKESLKRKGSGHDAGEPSKIKGI